MTFLLIMLACILLLPVLLLVGIALGPAALVMLFVAGIAALTVWAMRSSVRHGGGRGV